MLRLVTSFVLTLALGAGPAFAGEESGVVSISDGSYIIKEPVASTTYALPHRFIFQGTETLTCGASVWTRGADYYIDYDRGTVTVRNSGPYDGPLVITYSYLPYFQGDEFRELITGTEEETLEGIEERGLSESEFEITGSKTFTVSGGSDKDVSLDQSLRLSIEGNVANKVRVSGEISDQSLPVEETGVTEDISELDKITLRVETRNLAATFGDLDLEVKGPRYASYRKRVVGLQGEADYPGFALSGYGAKSKGRFASNEFYGIDGVQGPYQLTAEGTDDIQILPGTETVLVNGEPKEEGEGADYIMDYDVAVISFTERTVITSRDRITVDFEYFTESYRRDSFGSSGEARLAGDRYTVSYTYAHESDNTADPLFEPTKEEMYSLIHAGDDPARARTVATDEWGNVIYEYVGAGNGSYTREWDPVTGEYVYTYVGKGEGDYDPKVILLPLPVSHEVFDAAVALSPYRLLEFKSEGAVSEYDANTYSNFEDDDNAGAAGASSVSLRIATLEPVGKHFHDLTLTGRAETRDRNFSALTRNDPADFAQDWDASDECAGLAKPPEYRLYGGSLSVGAGPLSVSGGSEEMSQFFPRLSASGYRSFDMTRYYGALSVSENPLLAGNYGINIVKKTGLRVKPIGAPRTKYKYYEATDVLEFREQSGEIRRRLWRFVPYLSTYERKRVRDQNGEGALDDGLREYDFEAGTSFSPGGGWSVRYGHTEGRGATVSGGAFKPYYVSRTDKLGTTYDQPGLINVSGNYTRVRKYFATGSGESDAATDVGKVNLLYSPFERLITTKARYEADSTQSFEREEYFELAPDGDGDYVQEPDPENPGRFIYVYDPDDPAAYWVRKFRNTGRTFRTTEADLLTYIFLEPFRLAENRPELSRRARFWLYFASVETYFRIGEKSTGRNRMGILTFTERMNKDTVLGSFDRRYTLKIFPINPRFTLKGTYSDYENLDRTISYREVLSRRRSVSLEVLTEPIRKVTLRGKAEIIRDREEEREENVPEPTLETAAEWVLTGEPGYYLTDLWDVKITGEIGRRQEDRNGVGTTIITKKIKPGTVYRLRQSGNISAEYEREQNDVTGSTASDTLLLRLPGTTHRWEVEVSKGVGEYVTVILTYSGEKEPEDRTEHRGQVDLNIVF